MIYSVKGEIIHKETELCVIECAGVGYGLRTTFQTLSQIGHIGENAKLFTYLHVREDAVELFGFATREELNCFKMLISVSGVGPKAALAILSDSSPEKFAIIIATGDTKAVTRTKGIGPKLAQRIILELKDKIVKQQELISGADFDFTPTVGTGNASEAISALVVLGYSQSQAATIINKIPPETSVEEMIKQGLKHLAKNL